MNFTGKTALITGASKGIGAATAVHFASLGANVGLLARSAAPLNELADMISADGGQAWAYAGDVADYDVVANAVSDLVAKTGRIDFLINNAGVVDPVARIADSDPAAWAKVIDINVNGVYNGIRAVLPTMLAAGGGTIVNVSSGAATSALEGWSHYCASKAAVLMLTKSVHKEYAEAGIRSVGLSPGTVATDMQRVIKKSGINPVSQMPFDAHIPPDWPAKALAFLCTDAADEFLGGDFALRADEARRLVGLIE